MRSRPAWGKRTRIDGRALRWWLSFVLGAAAVLLLVPALQGERTEDYNGTIVSETGRVDSAAGGAEGELEGRAAAEGGRDLVRRVDGDDAGGGKRTGGGNADGATDASAQSDAQADPIAVSDSRSIPVSVYIAAEDRMETVPLETYVRGVVAGEMPADFEPEALKAQAIAARTYIVRKLLHAAGNSTGSRQADVTADVDDQVYIPLGQLMDQWPQDADAKLAKITRAVEETEGLILTYKGDPIQAAFFSTSGGHTENSEDYWSVSLPYLRSVPSPWDAQLSPRFKQTSELSLDEFYQALGIRKKDRKGGIKVVSRTEGRSIQSIKIGRKTFTGREVREKLGLASATFDWTVKDNKITITTFGYGHGVGMSQWGAQALARAGNDAKQILSYYYQGVAVESAAKLPAASGRL